jgi:glycosyltransferase involved in cell wall biosynthesis
MDKKILIITPYFAPQCHAAVFRAYKLAKYLPQFGWKPYVLTVDKNYLYPEDPELLGDLPKEVEVHTARYVEPTLRGLRMALGGRDRSFMEISKRADFSASSPDKNQSGGILARLYNYLLQKWILVPDAYWTWERSAIHAAKALIRENGIGLVFTSADPYTSHAIGFTLKKAGCTWVADLRDPHTHCHYMHSKFKRVFWRQREAEYNAVLNADAVTVASSAIGLILTDMYGVARHDKIHFIPTGLDFALVGNVHDADTHPDLNVPYLIFTGEYLSDYGDIFLRCFADAMKEADAATKYKLVFAGRKEVNEPILRPYIKALNLEKYIVLMNQLPQRELYALIQRSAATVVCSGPNALWWCLPAKMVDYIALKKPVLALVPDPSEARTRLHETGLGVFLDGGDNARARTLALFIDNKLPPVVPNEEACGRYTAPRQTEEFVKIFERL